MTANVRTLATLELVGNVLCLDFANTVNSRHRPVHDYLATYRDLLDWSEHSGALPTTVTRRLRTTDGGDAVLAQAWSLRDAVYNAFSALAAGRSPGRDAITRIGAGYTDAVAHATLSPAAEGYRLSWPPARNTERSSMRTAGHSPDAPLWPVAHSAGELLLTGGLDRLGECPGCGWLFLDVSRNGARRWCSMATCGSRDKMARYHRRGGTDPTS